MTNYVYIIVTPYGSKHCLRRYLAPQIIPQTLPKKILGSIGIVYPSISPLHLQLLNQMIPNDSDVTCHLSRRPALRSRPEDGSILRQLGLGGLMLALLFGVLLSTQKDGKCMEIGFFVHFIAGRSGRFWLFYLFRACFKGPCEREVLNNQWRILSTNTYGFNKFPEFLH